MTDTRPLLTAAAGMKPDNFWRRLKTRWSLVRTRLMLILSAVLAAVGALQATDLMPLFPPAYQHMAPVVAPILVAVLHVLTADPRRPKV